MSAETETWTRYDWSSCTCGVTNNCHLASCRVFDCCAYQSKSGKTTCGALRYYHDGLVKRRHKFVERVEKEK